MDYKKALLMTNELIEAKNQIIRLNMLLDYLKGSKIVELQAKHNLTRDDIYKELKDKNIKIRKEINMPLIPRKRGRRVGQCVNWKKERLKVILYSQDHPEHNIILKEGTYSSLRQASKDLNIDYNLLMNLNNGRSNSMRKYNHIKIIRYY